MEVFKGFQFYETFERFSAEEPFTVVPNWKCNGTNRYCGKMGAFAFEKEINATDGVFGDVRILIHDVRSGLGGITLVVEGIWNSSGGRLCMVGRVENVEPPTTGCYSRICLYNPISFTLTQQSIIFGQISLSA
ncbi:hypothetical protein MRB53_035475 [Persea americana]|uniref:Uncharacterized protein n=1 Tax=Persea americana TaxID=3435 RepID=A0ACC2K4Q9_PERAE|nr:hypothetical protein MRB53_035475 [Persea americana]